MVLCHIWDRRIEKIVIHCRGTSFGMDLGMWEHPRLKVAWRCIGHCTYHHMNDVLEEFADSSSHLRSRPAYLGLSEERRVGMSPFQCSSASSVGTDPVEPH